MKKALHRTAFFATFVFYLAGFLRADQVVMQNGDTYNGTVLSVTTNTVVLKSDNLGNATLPRAKVTAITFGSGASTATGPLARPVPASIQVFGHPKSPTNSVSGSMVVLRGIRQQTNLIQQVQTQYLAAAGPEAVNKFNALLDGLDSGKIDINDLRAQAQTAADQLRSLKKDLGPDSDSELDDYLAVLDNFLKETAPGQGSTNSVSATAKTPPIN